MTTEGETRPPHELFEERLEKAGWVFKAKGNGGKLNVWGEPGDDDDLRPNIWVPLNPTFRDYEEVLRRAAYQLSEWERKRLEADWTSPAPDGAYAELLTEWQERKRVHGKYEAAHPVRLRQAVMEAEAAGLHLAADAIQSLVFEATVQANNQQHLAEQIAELKRENEDLRTEANGWLKRVELVEGEVREWADAERDYQAECAGGFKPGEAHAVTQRLRRAETSLRQRARLEGEA